MRRLQIPWSKLGHDPIVFVADVIELEIEEPEEIVPITKVQKKPYVNLAPAGLGPRRPPERFRLDYLRMARTKVSFYHGLTSI